MLRIISFAALVASVLAVDSLHSRKAAILEVIKKDKDADEQDDEDSDKKKEQTKKTVEDTDAKIDSKQQEVKKAGQEAKELAEDAEDAAKTADEDATEAAEKAENANDAAKDATDKAAAATKAGESAGKEAEEAKTKANEAQQKAQGVKKTVKDNKESAQKDGDAAKCALHNGKMNECESHENPHCKCEGKEEKKCEKCVVDDSSSCFAGNAMVEMLTGKSSMSALKIGDVIRTGSGFEPVVGFLHAEGTTARFVEITTTAGVLPVSPDHMVFLSSGEAITAKFVKVGHELTSGVVVDVLFTTRSDGIYSPLTKSGTIMVEGNIASTYAAFTPMLSDHIWHAFAHLAVTPMRWLGISTSGVTTASVVPAPTPVTV